jgi:hypothetical protein
MKDIGSAVGIFLISLLVAVGVEKVLVIAVGVDIPTAAAVGMATLIGVGFWIIQQTAKKR